MERLTIGEKEIILVGTAHVSRESVELVKKTIETENPDVVGVELCRARFHQLKSGSRWKETSISKVIKGGKTWLFLLNLMLANLQRKIGQDVGTKAGSEMIEAINLAEEKELRVALLDRNVQVTLSRAFALMGLKEKIRIFFWIVRIFFGENEEISAEKIEELKQKDVMTELMGELSRKAPTIKRVLVDERDQFIANRIMKSSGKKIVAVVGAGHVDGIKNWLGKEVNETALMFVPKKKSVFSYLKYLVPVIFVSIFLYAFLSKGIGLSLQVFALWFLINGVLSAIGVALAKGHPFSIATAFLAAPFTSLHPAIAAGWFAGAMEAKKRNPKVKDFEDLQNIDGFSGLYGNRVTRTLLVTAYANIGSTIGTVIALPYLLSLLG